MDEGIPISMLDIKRWFSSDVQFHHLYPIAIQQLAQKHWTPLSIAQKAVQFLVTEDNVRILDIGSGAGKFCLSAAYYKPNAFYYGIEQRKSLIGHAEVAREILKLTNVSFIHGNFTQLDFKSYDHFYFYNSFYENLAFSDKIDESIAHSVALYDYYNRYLYKLLDQSPLGTKLVTFNSLGNEVPPGFRLIDGELGNLLRFWRKKHNIIFTFLFFTKSKSITDMKLMLILVLILGYCRMFAISNRQILTDTPLLVHHCNDFEITGHGENPEWLKANWIPLSKLDSGGKEDKTKFKILYSPTGIYVLFEGDDEKITSIFKNDFENLFDGDVFEVFFHPDPSDPIYFEYEVSPLDKELVLLILNMNGKFGSWMPWHYENKKQVVKKVNVGGGKMEMNASIKSRGAELFFPYQLLFPLKNVPPVSGTRWNANFCRLDYDSGHMIKWSWSPIAVSFHEFKKYWSLQFE